MWVPDVDAVEEVPEMGVYVITTFRDFFHIGSVECVTFQRPASQLRGGGVRVVVLDGVDGEEEEVGWRSVMVGAAGAFVGVVSGTPGVAAVRGEAMIYCTVDAGGLLWCVGSFVNFRASMFEFCGGFSVDPFSYMRRSVQIMRNASEEIC